MPAVSPTPASPYGDFLSMARENFSVGRNYFDIAVRRRMEDNLAHAYSRHASGSKFYTPEYDKRSKIFRPKTRTMLRKHEAAMALAFHSTRDIISCEPTDPDDDDNVYAAEVAKELLNLRLRDSIDWFQLSLGAYHDAHTQGVVISCQEWDYREAVIESDVIGEDGLPTGKTQTEEVVLRDSPSMRLVPVENIVIHPSSNWIDPINSSPYLIEQRPYHVNELVERIADARRYGSQVPYLKDFTESELLAGGTNDNNSAISVRMAREQNRVDRQGNVQQGQKFRIVWVHTNIVRIGGLDYVYETLGVTMMLSEPVPIEQVYGKRRNRARPYVMGTASIEPHRIYPSGVVEQVKGLQEGVNSLTNQRSDNVSLVLNNRFLVKRGQMVDARSLMRNVPGSITMTTDPSGDVKQLETKDVTSSSYQEQDRFNLEFDDIAGNFTNATVGSMKKQPNETVGGMEMLGQQADVISELSLQTIARTWAEKALQQIMDLESQFESDQKLLTLVSNRTKNKDWIKAFQSLDEPVKITVLIGPGNTDPMKKLQRFGAAMQQLQAVAPDLLQEIDRREVAHEIMGAAGYKDGTRFFPSLIDDKKKSPREQALEKQLQQTQQQLQEAQAGIPVAKIRAESAEKIAQIKADAQKSIADRKAEMDRYKAELTGQLKQLDIQIKGETLEVKRAGLLLEREALSHAIAQADRAFDFQVATTPAVSPALQADIPESPGEQQLAEQLRTPGSAGAVSAIAAPEVGQAPNLPGNDAAGVIQRGDYGMIPGREG
jgi:hypothetical protein